MNCCIFQRFWRSQRLYGTLNNSVENEGGVAHQMLLLQLSIPAVNFSVILKEIERTTLICDYF